MRKGAIVIAGILGTAVAVWAAGTALSIVFGTPTVDCPDGNVSADYTISTTAADGATVTEKLTDTNNVVVAASSYVIPPGPTPGGWTFAGRTKTHDGLFQANGLINGTYSLQVCVTQSGSGGNANKTVCNSETIVVDCAAAAIGNPCASAAPFGEVVGNDKISDHATAQINFEGDFGPTAYVEITGANGFYSSATVRRDGDSCNYHVRWKFTTGDGADIFGNDGAGVYTVKVTGNNHTLQFSATLTD